MNCKKCGKELDGELELCPECAAEETELTQDIPAEEIILEEEAVEPAAEETAEEAPAEEETVTVVTAPAAPISIWKVVAATAVCMLLLCVLAVMLINSITGKNWPFDQFAKETTVAPTTEAVTPSTTTEPVYTAEDLGMLEGINEKITFSADTISDENRSKVVATAGSLKLTNGQLQILFWSQFYRFVNNEQYTQYGLDPVAPLSEQVVAGSEVTWEQYFLDSALKTWQQYAALYLAAQEENYVLPADVQAALDGLIEGYGKQAVEAGFKDGMDLLSAQMGPGVTLEDMLAVETLFAIGDNYYKDLYYSQDPTREEVEAYFDENAEMFSTYYGVTKDIGKLLDVRHVLIQPEGCEFDERNYVVATDEQWESCRVEAQALLDAWVEGGATEDAFAQMAGEHSADLGSATNGGLCQYVSKGAMVPAFDAWLFEEGRKAGDYGLVKTEYGYHLMYFVGGDEAWYLYGRESSDGILSKTCRDKIAGYVEANPMEVSFADILLGKAKLSVAETETDPTATTE